jgi:hypothetical protein
LTTQVLRALLRCSNDVERASFDVSSLDFGRPQGRPFFLAKIPSDTIQPWINKDQGVRKRLISDSWRLVAKHCGYATFQNLSTERGFVILN